MIFTQYTSKAGAALAGMDGLSWHVGFSAAKADPKLPAAFILLQH